jgi:S1-C subfamily serine protease
MKNIFLSMLITGLVLSLLFCNTAAAQSEPPRYGTGFFFGPNGLAISALHVVDGCKKIDSYVSLDWRKTNIIASPKDFHGWEKYDFVILKVDYDNTSFISLSDNSLNLLDSLIVAGFPYAGEIGTGLTVSRGIKNANVFNSEISADFQFDAAIQPGMSGGPILDDFGKVDGIINGSLDEIYAIGRFGAIPQSVNFGTSIDLVLAFMASNMVAIDWFSKKEINETRSVDRIIRDDIFSIRCID